MPKLIMLVGVPGCGKSTWIDSFNTGDDPFTVISLDSIVEEMGIPEGLSYQDAFKKYANVAARKMKERLKEALENQDNIIWDQTNLTVKSRRKKLKGVPDDYNLIANVWELDPDELERRRVFREKTTGKIIPKFVMENMQKSYARPTKSEGFERIQIITE